MSNVSFFGRLSMAIKAFREAYVTAGVPETGQWEDFGARQMRYDMLWALYENTAYRNIHTWATAYRNQYGLYKYIRNIYNPAYRLGEFWKSMIWGGMVDAQAGDEGAIPILTEFEELRQAISRVWKNSNWNINKDILTLYGAVLGDVGIYIRDDTSREQVRLEVIHPSTLKSVTLDAMGFVKGYQLEESRDLNGKSVVYAESAEREAGTENVIYRTLANGKPYAWNGETAEWNVPYGFIPLVAIQHNNVGLDWGWSEIHPGRSKFNEVDDLSSKLHDQIRKMVDAPWFFSGVKKGADSPSTSGAAATMDRPQPGREETPAIYAADPNAKAMPLVAPLDIAATYGTVTGLLQEIERDYPELQMDIWTASGDASGRALRTARQRSETKVKQRRPNYDSGLVRAQQMAVAIGGMRGYEGFEGYDLDSYKAGKLEHSIDDRPVFASDPLDIIEQKKVFWEAVGAATTAGVSVEAALKDLGWSDEKINEIYGGMPEQ